MAKLIAFDEEARRGLERGLNTLADAVKVRSSSRKLLRRLTTSQVTVPPPLPFWLRRWSARACATWLLALTR